MKSFAVLLFLAGLVHLGLQVPLVIAGGAALLLWILWKLKYVILALVGLEMLFGGNGGDGGVDA
ncbi:hypothetical protein [Telmatospirillum siberiense]|uniref:Uncharacterized protein n=1 Tax=Telmatospirillum siberiense TaxID=382514 RepID=A0A2N3PT96_9PROT|nr:hypothetical protein [Telmatospirillum siberiense]PKU23629.1 hypothetical protein CWS72_15220 [Telmatospirillum siberiense]